MLRMEPMAYANAPPTELHSQPNFLDILNSRALKIKLRMISHSFNASCWETATGEPGIQGHPWVWNESEASLGYV